MTYLELLLPVLRVVGFILLVLLCAGGCLAAFFGIVDVCVSNSYLKRRYSALILLAGLLIAIFGIPFTIWVNGQFWPKPEPIKPEKTLFEEFKECREGGSNWYMIDQPGDQEPVYVCSKEPIYPEDLQPTP